jgi:hypothetical protein
MGNVMSFLAGGFEVLFPHKVPLPFGKVILTDASMFSDGFCCHCFLKISAASSNNNS